jgi:hypothetical protein
MYEEVAKTLGTLSSKTLKEYETYFEKIKPKTSRERFRRGVFALSSVHTTWRLNVALYDALWDLTWAKDPELLRARIIESRAGLVNNRVKAFSMYAAMFNQYPKLFERQDGETWYGFRDRIMDTVHGLGPAKSAFYSELVYFEANRVPCMDTHMLQLYGVKPKDVGTVKNTDRTRMEAHFDLTCDRLGINPVTARWVIWDKKQGKKDSRYWSHVLEGRPKVKRTVQITFTM